MSMNGLDIADFAESLVTNQVNEGKPVQFAAATSPDAPDISNIQIPSDFASQVLSESFNLEVEEPIKPPVKKPSQSIPSEKQPINEAAIYKQHIVEEYKKKVADLEDLIKVMESMGIGSIGGQVGSGHIGTNAAGPAPDPGNPPRRKTRAKKRNRNDLYSRLNRRS